MPTGDRTGHRSVVGRYRLGGGEGAQGAGRSGAGVKIQLNPGAALRVARIAEACLVFPEGHLHPGHKRGTEAI